LAVRKIFLEKTEVFMSQYYFYFHYPNTKLYLRNDERYLELKEKPYINYFRVFGRMDGQTGRTELLDIYATKSARAKGGHFRVPKSYFTDLRALVEQHLASETSAFLLLDEPEFLFRRKDLVVECEEKLLEVLHLLHQNGNRLITSEAVPLKSDYQYAPKQWTVFRLYELVGRKLYYLPVIETWSAKPAPFYLRNETLQKDAQKERQRYPAPYVQESFALRLNFRELGLLEKESEEVVVPAEFTPSDPPGSE
jgi:hypothetical protein